MEIEVKGHSGCSINIMRQGKDLYILKGTKDVKYIERLYRQAVKQEKAAKRKYQFIRIPSILDIKKTDSEMIMQMEYIYAKNFIDYFENAGFEQVDYFIKAIDIFLNSEINNSELQRISSDVVKDKFFDVKHKIESNIMLNNDSIIKDIIKQSEIIFGNIPDNLYIPIGECHGDLTFSNILFHELVHATTKYVDNDRRFENELGMIIGKLSDHILTARAQQVTPEKPQKKNIFSFIQQKNKVKKKNLVLN